MNELSKIVDQLSKLSVIEASELAKKLEEAWGVQASTSSGMNSEAQTTVKKNEPEEKLEYDVVLESIGDKKINVIKEVKSITGVGLREAKELVESAPKLIKSSVEKKKAEEMKNRLESVGAKVSLK
jgi:large subunit ribosomal protein L7/L12